MKNALQSHEQITEQIEAVLPKEKVMREANIFLDRCGWKLEIDATVISIPQDIQIGIRSRSYVKADAEDVFLGDHYEAVILIGIESIGEYNRAKYGILRMYFDLQGRFVSEDRHNQYS